MAAVENPRADGGAQGLGHEQPQRRLQQPEPGHEHGGLAQPRAHPALPATGNLQQARQEARHRTGVSRTFHAREEKRKIARLFLRAAPQAYEGQENPAAPWVAAPCLPRRAQPVGRRQAAPPAAGLGYEH